MRDVVMDSRMVPAIQDWLMAESSRHDSLEQIAHHAKMLTDFLGRCGSPIEQHLAIALFKVDTRSNVARFSLSDNGPHIAGVRFDWVYLVLHGQYSMSLSEDRSVFFDFAICVPGERVPFVVVECDGHQFHERTPEQAVSDRSRDRLCAELGITVLRFTGREIVADANGCAEQVFRVMDSCERLCKARDAAIADIERKSDAYLSHLEQSEQ